MSIKQMNFGNQQRFSSKAVQKNSSSFAQASLKCQNLNCQRQERILSCQQLVFEQQKDPVIQWLSFIIIQKLVILLKLNIEETCV